MESMVHARGQTQRNVGSAAVEAREFRVAQQLQQRIRLTFGLDQRVIVDPTARTDDGVARANENGGIPVDRPCAVLELPDKAIVHAAKLRRLASPRSTS